MKVTAERIRQAKERLKLLLFLVENGVDRRQSILEYNRAKSIYNDLITVYNLGRKECILKKVC